MSVIHRIIEIDEFIKEYSEGSWRGCSEAYLLVAQLNYEKLVIESGHWCDTPAEKVEKITKYNTAIELVKSKYKDISGKEFPEDWGM